MANTLTQLPKFLGAIYGGLIVGVLYDVFSLIRLPFSGKWVIAIIDSIYLICSGAVIAGTLFLIDSGSIRLYLLLGVALGLFLYLRFTSALIRRGIRRLMGFFGKK